MEEGRKRVLAISTGILVAGHLRTREDLFDTRETVRAHEHGTCRRSVGKSDHGKDRRGVRKVRNSTLHLPLLGHPLTSAVPFTSTSLEV